MTYIHTCIWQVLVWELERYNHKKNRELLSSLQEYALGATDFKAKEHELWGSLSAGIIANVNRVTNEAASLGASIEDTRRAISSYTAPAPFTAAAKPAVEPATHPDTRPAAPPAPPPAAPPAAPETTDGTRAPQAVDYGTNYAPAPPSTATPTLEPKATAAAPHPFAAPPNPFQAASGGGSLDAALWGSAPKGT